MKKKTAVIVIRYADSHCDTASECYEKKWSLFESDNNISINKLRKSVDECAIITFAAWTEKKRYSSPFSQANDIITNLKNEISSNSNIIIIKNSNDVTNIENENLIGAILSIECADCLEDNIDNLYHFYNHGVKMISLSWNSRNSFGGSSMDNEDEGITDLGKSLLKVAEELNMIIDLSHSGKTSFYDILNNFKGSVLVSHTNSFAVCPHPRNIDDDQINALLERNGYIGLNFWSDIISTDKPTTVDDLIKHVEHIINLNKGNTTNIGFGSDYDGIVSCCEGIEDISKIRYLYDKLVNYFGNNIADTIIYGNYSDYIKNSLR